MFLLNKKELNKLVKVENKLAQDKRYYNEFCALSTIIENILERDYYLQTVDQKQKPKQTTITKERG